MEFEGLGVLEAGREGSEGQACRRRKMGNLHCKGHWGRRLGDLAGCAQLDASGLQGRILAILRIC